MKGNNKTKKQLVLEIEELRARLDTTELSLKGAKEGLQAKITEHMRAKEAFENTKQYAQNIVETIREPLLVLAADLKVISANHSFYQTFKVTPEETEGRFIYNLGKRQWNIPGLRELLEEIIPENTQFNDFKVNHEFPAIGRRTMLLNARRIYRESGGTEMILLAIEDITERTQWEEALNISETRYRRLFETAQDGILILDADTGQISDVNPFLVEMLGYSHEDVLGKKLWEIGAFKDVEASKAGFSELQNKGYVRYEDLPLETRDGRHIAVEFVSNVYLVDHKKVIQCNIRDITKRKETEKELTRLASFPQLNPNPIVEVDLAGYVHYSNPAAERLFPDLKKAGLNHPWLIDFQIIRGTLETGSRKIHVRELKVGGQWYQQTVQSVMEGTRLRVYGLDITERKQAEEAIKVSEERAREHATRLQAVLDTAPAIIWIARDGECREITGNHASHVFLRVPEGTDMSKSGPESDRLAHYRVFKDGMELAAREMPIQRVAASGQELSDYPMEIVFNDGSVRSLLGNISPVFDSEGRPNGAIAAFLDITERKRMAEELRKSRDELEIRVQERTREVREQSRILDSFFKFSVTPFVILDKDFNFIRVNEAYAKACHREVAEFPGHNHFEFYPSDAKAKFEQVVQTKKPHVAIARPFSFPDHPEWGVTYWDWTLTPILDDAGEVGSLVFSLVDVTDRKRAEEIVKAEKQRFNDVLEVLPAYVALLTPDYHMPFANRVFRERFGESHGRRCFEFLFERSEPCEICESYTSLKTMAPHRWEWTGPDGRIYDVFDFPFADTDGSILILEMGIDITERKKAEEAVRDASLYTRSLIEASLDPLVTISADGKIMDVNSATELTTGVPRDELIGTDFSDYFTEPEKAREGYQRVFREGSVRDYPLAIRHTSGKVSDVLYHATVFRNEAGKIQGVFAAARDITARKRGEAALRESENRLRLLSSQLINVQEGERKRIAREIHDSIGQTLAAIKFGLENKLSQMGGGAAPPGVSIENIISLTQSGIEESRRIQMDLRPSILDDLGILATIGWFTREFQKVYTHISVEKHISVEENEIPDSLRTVLFRVMQEAMNNVAKHSKADLIRLILKKTADKIELSIKDNGAGFDLESIRQGLGLTSMRERTELSGGTFAVESILGKGTTIRASWTL